MRIGWQAVRYGDDREEEEEEEEEEEGEEYRCERKEGIKEENKEKKRKIYE